MKPGCLSKVAFVCVCIINDYMLSSELRIPACLFLSAVMKCGMSCSLFEVVDGKGKPTSGSLAALVNKLERDRMVSHIPAVYPDSLCKINTTFSGCTIFR